MSAMSELHAMICEAAGLDPCDPDQEEANFDLVSDAIGRVDFPVGLDLLPQFCRTHILAELTAAQIPH